jgi:hypothetical protein
LYLFSNCLKDNLLRTFYFNFLTIPFNEICTFILKCPLSAWDTLVSRLCSKNMSRALFYDKSGSVSGVAVMEWK